MAAGMSTQRDRRTLRLPPDVNAQLDARAQVDGKSANDVIVDALRAYMSGDAPPQAASVDATHATPIIRPPPDLAEIAMAATGRDPVAASYWLLERARKGIALDAQVDRFVETAPAALAKTPALPAAPPDAGADVATPDILPDAPKRSIRGRLAAIVHR